MGSERVLAACAKHGKKVMLKEQPMLCPDCGAPMVVAGVVQIGGPSPAGNSNKFFQGLLMLMDQFPQCSAYEILGALDHAKSVVRSLLMGPAPREGEDQ